MTIFHPAKSANVTVVIPTFNACLWLAETLHSVIAQTLDRLEIIVVDNGSTDGTAAMVKQHFPSIILIEQKNAGVSKARNAGLAQASAPMVCFLDQDDLWHPSQLQRQRDCLIHHADAVAVATPYWFWQPDIHGQYPHIDWPPDPGVGAMVPGYDSWTYHLFLLDCWALTSATMLRTAWLQAAGGFDETLPYSEDWEMWLRLSRQRPFLQLAWPPVKYRQHAVQGSRKVRCRDYRTELLTATVSIHGLCSANGQCLDRRAFRRQLASYRMEFGYHLLQAGHRIPAARALMDAWRLQPIKLKWAALALAALTGWRPPQDSSR